MDIHHEEDAGQYLVSGEEVVYVCPGVMPAAIARTARQDWCEVRCIPARDVRGQRSLAPIRNS